MRYQEAMSEPGVFYSLEPGDGTRYDFLVVPIIRGSDAAAIVKGCDKHALLIMLSPGAVWTAYAFQTGLGFYDAGYVASKLNLQHSTYTAGIVAAMLPALMGGFSAKAACEMAQAYIQGVAKKVMGV